MKRSLVEAGNHSLLTKTELSVRLSVSGRKIEDLVRRRKIPVIDLGYRTKRFNWDAVVAALARFEVKEVGRHE